MYTGRLFVVVLSEVKLNGFRAIFNFILMIRNVYLMPEERRTEKHKYEMVYFSQKDQL